MSRQLDFLAGTKVKWGSRTSHRRRPPDGSADEEEENEDKCQKLNGMIELTDSAAFIWKQVDTAKDLEEIVARVREEYEVEEEAARRDIYGFLRELYIRGIVQDIPEMEEKISGEQHKN